MGRKKNDTETRARNRRRGVAWDLFDTGNGLEIQRVDCPDEPDAHLFDDDEEAAGFVVCQAQWEKNPDRTMRDACREALRELIDQWPRPQRHHLVGREEIEEMRETAGYDEMDARALRDRENEIARQNHPRPDRPEAPLG